MVSKTPTKKSAKKPAKKQQGGGVISALRAYKKKRDDAAKARKEKLDAFRRDLARTTDALLQMTAELKAYEQKEREANEAGLKAAAEEARRRRQK